MNNKSFLLFKKKFLSLFLVQFTSAFSDNLYKCLLSMFFTYSTIKNSSLSGEVLVAVVAGVFILPFVLFSQIAGQIADKYEKSKLIKILKIAELFLNLLGVISIYTENINIMMITLFFLGMQASIFGPVKYSALPCYLEKSELISGNSLIEFGTFLAILIGTIVGGIYDISHHKTIITIILLSTSIIGFCSSYYIAKAEPADQNLKINYNIYSSAVDLIKLVKSNRSIFLSILGISWFWMIGGMFITQLPNYVKITLSANEHVATLLFSIFSIGISIGSVLCNRLMKGEVNANYIPITTLGISVFTFDLSNISYLATEYLMNIEEFIRNPTGIRVLFDLIMISLCSGIYIVPLYVIMQQKSSETHRSRTIAANNLFNTFFIFVFSMVSALLIKNKFSINDIFLITSILNFIVFLYMCKLLPEVTIKYLLRQILKLFYRVEIKGMENYVEIKDRALLVANHTSYLDAVLLASFFPGKLTFAVNSLIAEKWWVKPFLSLVEALKIDPTNPMATKTLIKALDREKKCVIFPEGRITLTGSMMKIYEGPAIIASKAKSPILPVCIEGALYSPFSKVKNKVKIRLFPKIRITIMPSLKLLVLDDLSSRERRYNLGAQLYDVMSNTLFKAIDNEKTIYQKLIEARQISGGCYKVIEDISRKEISYDQLIMKSIILGRCFLNFTSKNQYVGIVLPNMSSTIFTFFGLSAFERIPTMINYSSGTAIMIAACKTANLKLLITSRLFIEKAKLVEFINQALKNDLQILYLEDLASEISVRDKIVGFILSLCPKIYYKLSNQNLMNSKNAADQPALVLFTSGSENLPKAVVLSHKNILTNKSQLVSRIDFGPSDTVFNALPLFHSFGMTGGTMLPILSGIKVFFYPTPLHYRIIPEMIYDTNATIMFGTDTFLANYAKQANPYDFYSIRYVFAGAEKLRDKTYYTWLDKFGIKIFEGYGTTEASPVVSANTPMHNKFGTVGRIMPGISYNLEPVEGMKSGMKLSISGDNIMLGYMFYDNPGVINYLKNNIYDTGDVVEIDNDGYITICGRVKRFAKIAGEMISLASVESYISKLWSEYDHAVINVEDERKGEQLILVTNNKDAQRETISNYMKNNNLHEFMIPKKIIHMEKLPLLGSGKIDYNELKKIVTNY